MKKINVVATMVIGAVVSMSSAIASATPFLPPERIQCSNTRECQGFNSEYLTVTSDTGVGSNQKVTLNFVSGESIGGNVNFLYQTADQSRLVHIGNVSSNIGPDLDSSNGWVMDNGVLRCDAYMSCPLKSQ